MDLQPQANVKEAVSYISLWRKTNALIGKIAAVRGDWSMKDIDIMRRGTGTAEFSQDDIRYKYELMNNEAWDELSDRIDLLMEYLPKVRDTKERISFYNREVKPLVNERVAIEDKIRKKYKGLVFYKKQETVRREFTNDELEEAYRIRQKQYRREDAKNALFDMWEQDYGYSEKALKAMEMDWVVDRIVSRFERMQDSNVPENTTWVLACEAVISEEKI